MSKCDLRIVFDRSDRAFRGGDEVNGTVYVRVNQNVECNGIVVERFWQTHGRGNTATGPRQSSVVYRGRLGAGQSLKYPFRFTAPDGPPTYHGRYLNVDHYVNVRVDIPWAIDPKCKEEYVLMPGRRPYGNLPTATRRAAGLKSGVLNAGPFVGGAMILFGAIFFFPCGLVLIPLGLVVMFFGLRKILAEKKIGKVRVYWGSLGVPPGGSLPLRMVFTPRQSSRLNKITAKLVGQERCVSGSGTNRTTHTHKFFERTTVLAPQCEVVAGRPIQLDGQVPVPQTPAFSFHASDNELSWELEVRIDIPLWPDWIEKRTIVVRPAVEPEIVEATVVEEPTPAVRSPDRPLDDVRPPVVAPVIPVAFSDPGATPAEEEAEPFRSVTVEVDEPWEGEKEGEDTAEPAPAVAPPEPEVPEASDEPEPPAAEEPPPARPAATDPALVGIVGRIASADRYSRGREDILEQESAHAFDCAIEIAKVERTYTYIPDQRFRKGRTVTGKLQGTDCEVSVELPEARNEEIDSLGEGGLVQAKCNLLKWNTMYDRLEMREA